MSMRSWIRNLFTRPATRQMRKAPRRARLSVETLEDRWVPATITVGSLLDTSTTGTAGVVTLREAINAVNSGVANADFTAANLSGAFRVIQACLPGMRERRYGRIVVVSSSAAAVGLPGQVAYAASKAGLLGMMKTIAAENVRRGITANAVLPGLIASERVRAMPAELYKQIESTFLPSGRMGEVAEVAALVAHLASEDAGYVTGQEIGIDGGAWLNTLSLTREQRE